MIVDREDILQALLRAEPAQLPELLNTCIRNELSLRHAAILAAFGGNVALTEQLLARQDGRSWLITTEKSESFVVERLRSYLPDNALFLVSQPPIVIAACQLNTGIVKLLLQHCAPLPATVGDSSGTIPLLSFWASRLQAGGNHPAALPMLQLLLSAGADPLAAGAAQERSELAVCGRVGTICSFLLTCNNPLLLEAAVRHTLAQCAAINVSSPSTSTSVGCSGGRELMPPQLAVMLVAARLAGMDEEAEQLLAHAVLIGDCFPGLDSTEAQDHARQHMPPNKRALEKRRRLLVGAVRALNGPAWGSTSEEEGPAKADGEMEGWSDDEDGVEYGSGAVRGRPPAAPISLRAAPRVLSRPEDLRPCMDRAQKRLDCAQHRRQLAEMQLDAARALHAEVQPGAAQSLARGEVARVLRAVRDACAEMASAQARLQMMELRHAELLAGWPPHRHMAQEQERQGQPRAAAGHAADEAGPSASVAAVATAAGALDGTAPFTSAGPGFPTASITLSASLPGPLSPGRSLSQVIAADPDMDQLHLCPDSRQREWFGRLRAQLVADACMHGLLDVLDLLLSQGASPAQAVPLPMALSPRAPVGLRRMLRAVPSSTADGQHDWLAHGDPSGPHLHPTQPQLPVAPLSTARSAERSPLALAAGSGHCDCIELLVRHGASVDISALLHALWSFNVRGVEALLAWGRHSLPLSMPCTFAEGLLSCPMLLLLRRHLDLAAVPVAAAGLSRSALRAQAVRIMDLLYDAGFRIRVYRDMCGKGPDGVWRMGRVEGLQEDELARLEVAGRNRVLWRACCRPTWSTKAHVSFHPAFKAAAKTLLLAARWGEEKQAVRRGNSMQMAPGTDAGSLDTNNENLQETATLGPGDAEAGSVAAAAMGRLPPELIQRIIEEAAYPLSSWICLPVA